jgi:hypothetical protein
MRITMKNLVIILIMAVVGFYVTTALVKGYGDG